MPVHTFSSRDFTRDVSAAERAAVEGPVFISDRGRPAFALLKIEDYYRLNTNVISELRHGKPHQSPEVRAWAGAQPVSMLYRRDPQHGGLCQFRRGAYQSLDGVRPASLSPPALGCVLEFCYLFASFLRIFHGGCSFISSQFLTQIVPGLKPVVGAKFLPRGYRRCSRPNRRLRPPLCRALGGPG